MTNVLSVAVDFLNLVNFVKDIYVPTNTKHELKEEIG